MREFIRPVAAALEYRLPRGLDGHRFQRQRPGAGQAADGARSGRAAADTPVKQMALTEKQVQGVLAASKDMDAITAKLPENAQPDAKATAQLDAVAKKNGFASYDEYNNVTDNIGLVMAGFDPATKKYVGNEAVIKAQIAQVQADKKMSAKDKKEALADLNEALKSAGAADPEQGQYRPGRQILRQARGLRWATTSSKYRFVGEAAFREWNAASLIGNDGDFRVRAARVDPEIGMKDRYSAACAVAAGEPEQRIVVHGLDRREVAMGDVFRPGRRADVVRNRVQRQIDDLARIGRDVAGRAVHQIAVEHQHAAGLAGRCDNAALLDQPRHGFLVQRPQRIRGGLEVVRRLEIAGGWLFGTSINGPLIGITSSRKIAMFIARGSGMPSSRFQVP